MENVQRALVFLQRLELHYVVLCSIRSLFVLPKINLSNNVIFSNFQTFKVFVEVVLIRITRDFAISLVAINEHGREILKAFIQTSWCISHLMVAIIDAK